MAGKAKKQAQPSRAEVERVKDVLRPVVIRIQAFPCAEFVRTRKRACCGCEEMLDSLGRAAIAAMRGGGK